MTALETTTTASVEAPKDAPSDAKSRRRTRRGAPTRVVAICGVALIVLIIAWGLFAAFEGPVARSWYSMRRHSLAAQFAAPGLHRGTGNAVALVQIPSLGTNVVVAEGDSAAQLRDGPGHHPGSVMPGERGNSVIVGHQSAWGAPFRGIDKMTSGKHIVVQVQDANGVKQNVVFTVQTVAPIPDGDRAVFAGATDRRLTLITGDDGKRVAVVAVSGPVGRPTAAVAGRPSIPTAGSFWNAETLLAVLGFGGAIVLALVMRRRYHWFAIAAVTVPIALVGLLGLLLNIDAALAPLR